MPANRGIASQITVPFALFVTVGSLGLVMWLTEREREESRRAFRDLAQTNAQFIARSNLPASGGLAESLSEVLEIEVVFGDGDAPFALELESGLVADLGDGREAVTMPIRPGESARFIREREGFADQFWRGSTLLPLIAFWALSLILALVVSTRFVRPIRRLAEAVGAMAEADEQEFPGAGRPDEIGQLSRALTEARGRLADERRKREANEKAAVLGKMATGLAHEIRNPVAAVRLHAQLLESCERCAASAATIVAEAETVEGLVNQWMFLSKPEPPEQRLQDIGALLEDTMVALGPAFRHAGVDVEIDWDAGVRANVDAKRLGQVFRNLALNSLQAMPGGGRLRLSLCVDKDEVVVAFLDEGRGFSPEALERYGELFFSTKEGGMGVGLSVSVEVARAHGGRVEVSNRAGGGSMVRVRLPAAASQDGQT